MSDEKYWLSLWTMGSIALILFSLVIARFHIMQQEQLLELVRLGADPMVASCALRDDLNDDPNCMALAQRNR